MRRVAAAFLAPLAVAAALAGCSSSPTPTTPNASVTVSGTAGKAPTVKIPALTASSGLITKTLIKGSGPVLATGDSYLANFDVYLWRGKTHKLLFSSYTTTPEALPVQMGLSGLQQALSGQRIGSRVLAVLPPKFGYGTAGNKQIGVKPTDTLVWVVDLLQEFPPTASASGKVITNGGGSLPKVFATPGSSPTISIPKSTPPSKLIVSTLIKGTGAPVKTGQAIVVRYVASIWRTGKVFNNDWPSASAPTTAPNVFVLGQVIPAWNTGLVGVPVGSRVMLVVPPADGYKKAGNPQAGITGTDTLVFVVDILATAS
jgi:FKBP-type peptidyl-prolyl cis-trans isomerase